MLWYQGVRPWHPRNYSNRIQIMIRCTLKTAQLLLILTNLITNQPVDCSQQYIVSRQVQRTKQDQIK